MSNPLVSCLCCTYGRPQLLGEAIKCFMDQDYDNKELIVLNDQEGVNLVKHPSIPPNVHFYNIPVRFESLGQKRNYIKGLAHGEYFCIWDDDDLYMPHRITQSVKLIRGGSADIIKAQYAVMSVHNNNYTVTSNLFHSQACITQNYMQTHKYLDKSVGEDIHFEQAARVASINVKPMYVYRWGLNIHHLSGIADDTQSWNRSLSFEPYKRVQGEVLITPSFQNDYWKIVEELLSREKSKYRWL